MKDNGNSVSLQLGRRFTRIYALVVAISTLLVVVFFIGVDSRQQKKTDARVSSLLQNTLVDHLQYFEFAATPATLTEFNTILQADRIAVYDRYDFERGATGAVTKIDVDERPPDKIVKLFSEDDFLIGSLHFWASTSWLLGYEFQLAILLPALLIALMMEIARRAVNKVAAEEVLAPLEELRYFVQSAQKDTYRKNVEELNTSHRHTEFSGIKLAFQNAYGELAKEIKEKEIEVSLRKEQSQTLERVLSAADIVISHYSADMTRGETNIGAHGSECIRAAMNLQNFSCDQVCETLEMFGGNVQLVSTHPNITKGGPKPTVEPIYRLEVEEKDGTHWILAAVPMHDGGIALVAKNETALRKAEIELRQSQKMDALGVLTSGVAHDFNNILAILIGALEEIHFLNLEKDQENVEIALETGHRATRVVRQLLDYASSETKTAKPVDQFSMLGKLVNFLPSTIGPKWQIEFTPQTHAHVQCDPNLFEAAILNLIVNARDASPDGGRITVSSHEADEYDYARLRLDPSGQKYSRYICIAVTDEGMGIGDDVAAKAFDPFFTTKGRGRGTGLGLAMVYGMANRAGGTVYFTANRPHGTRVSILLPFAQPAEKVRTNRTQLAETTLHNTQAIIVEDEPLLMKVLQRKLEAAGITVFPCTTIKDVLDILATPDITVDFLLTDVQMPDNDGYEVARRVHKFAPYLPMILMSGNLERDRIAELGFPVGAIAKPFGIDDLADALHSIPQRSATITYLPRAAGR